LARYFARRTGGKVRFFDCSGNFATLAWNLNGFD
jgi:hypothetical protein